MHAEVPLMLPYNGKSSRESCSSLVCHPASYDASFITPPTLPAPSSTTTQSVHRQVFKPVSMPAVTKVLIIVYIHAEPKAGGQTSTSSTVPHPHDN